MKRRDLLLLPAAAAIACNPALAAVETPRIGFVQVGSRQENRSLLDAFRETLSALGWTDGSNIAIVERSAGERTEQLPGIIEKLIASGVAVLVTVGSPATLAAARASAATPIVLVGVDDPVGLGVVESLEQPGGNITGFSLTSTEVIAQRLRLLQELVPGLRRLAVIVRADPGLEQKLQDYKAKSGRSREQARQDCFDLRCERFDRFGKVRRGQAPHAVQWSADDRPTFDRWRWRGHNCGSVLHMRGHRLDASNQAVCQQNSGNNQRGQKYKRANCGG